jgi:hypothetical protein
VVRKLSRPILNVFISSLCNGYFSAAFVVGGEIILNNNLKMWKKVVVTNFKENLEHFLKGLKTPTRKSFSGKLVSEPRINARSGGKQSAHGIVLPWLTSWSLHSCVCSWALYPHLPGLHEHPYTFNTGYLLGLTGGFVSTKPPSIQIAKISICRIFRAL